MAMSDKVLEWIFGRDTGRSSLTIVAYMEDVECSVSHPYDLSDFGRCVRLLEIAPKYRKRLKHMVELSPEWKGIIENWDEIERLYHIAVSSNNQTDIDAAYTLLRTSYEPGYVAQPRVVYDDSRWDDDDDDDENDYDDDGEYDDLTGPREVIFAEDVAEIEAAQIIFEEDVDGD